MIQAEDKQRIIGAIDEAHQNGARLIKACELIQISLRTLQRWRGEGIGDKRKGSCKRVVRKLDEEHKQNILRLCQSREYADMNPHEIVPVLLDKGEYLASTSTIYRVLREADMIHHRANWKKPSKRTAPPQRVATKSNQVWCWDITWLPAKVRGLFYYAYVIMDLYDRSIVAWRIEDRESEVYSRRLFEEVVGDRQIQFEYIHSDNGHPMKGSSLISFLQLHHIEMSFNRPGVSNDNPYVESLFRTVKYSRIYPDRFKSIEYAREWMSRFERWYNTQRLHPQIGSVTPMQLRQGASEGIFRNRNKVMSEAVKKNPERWGRKTPRIWQAPKEVILH